MSQRNAFGIRSTLVSAPRRGSFGDGASADEQPAHWMTAARLVLALLLGISVLEQMVFQACNHPFVLQMDYAFQTELHAIIVLNLITTGNLQVFSSSAYFTGHEGFASEVSCLLIS